jgi:hypothetical protein
LLGELGSQFHEFGLGGGGVVVVVGDIQHVIVRLDLVVEVVGPDQFVDTDIHLRFLIG